MPLFSVLIIVLSAFGLAHANIPPIWQPPFYNGVAAQIEQKLITYDDVRRELIVFNSAVKAQSTTEADYNNRMSQLYPQVLDSLIERALLVSEFQAKGFKIPAKDIDAEYKRVLKENFGGKLSEMVDNLQKQGLTIAEYRKRLGENIMAQAMQSRFRRQLPSVTPEQIVAYYRSNMPKFAQEASVHIKAITVKPLADEPAEVLLQTAIGAAEKLKQGVAFEEVAAEYSQDNNTDWGWLKLNDLAPEVKAAVANLQAGESTAPLSFEGKVVVLQLAERKDEQVAEIEAVRPQIEKAIYEKNAQTAYEKWIAELRAKYFVKINS